LGIQQAAQGNRPDPQGQFFEPPATRYVQVNREAVRVENGRGFGGPWRGLQILRKLGLTELLDRLIEPGQEDVPWPMMAWVRVLSRLCEPSSELHIAEHFYEHSAIADLLGVPAAKVNDDRLYRTPDAMLPHKAALERHLKERLGNLFGLEYDLLLYDVTSTYFEGQADGNALAQRGDSRDHRGDCKQVCIGLVVTPEGQETFLLCRSADRQAKERAMHERFEKRIEEGLVKIQATCRRQRSDKGRMERRVGRLLGQNPRAAGLFEVAVTADGRGAAQVVWQKREAWRAWANLSEGCYLLRSNAKDWTGEELWRAYMQLAEGAEGAFRIQKSDLDLRPIWHQKPQRVKAHILVCFLTYVIWKTLGQMCREAGLGDEPRKVLKEIGRIPVVDVVMPTSAGIEIRQRCVRRPTRPSCWSGWACTCPNAWR
jgi:hypothetical protein